jgi:transposase
MRVSTAFNKLLRLQGASVIGVTFGAEGVLVAVRLRRRRSRCSGCGRRAPIHDRSTRRWRHLDLGAQRCHLEAEIRRVRCAECGVKVEEVPFARPRARHTRDLEDLTAFLAQQANKTTIAKLLRIDWATVGRIVERVVADHLDAERLRGLVMIGVDDVSWRRRHRYLTCVADHIGGGVVWVREGRSAATLGEFFEELGEEKVTIQAVSIDMSAGYEKAIREAVPQPRRVERAGQVQEQGRALGEGDALGAAEGAREPHRQTGCGPGGGAVGQQAPLPGFPAEGGAAGALPRRRPRGGRSPPRRLARLGIPLQAEALRQARPHDPRAP